MDDGMCAFAEGHFKCPQHVPWLSQWLEVRMTADRQTEALCALFVIGYAAHPDKWIGKAEIYEIIGSHAETGAFSWFVNLAAKGSKHRLGKDLRQFKDRELDGVLLMIDDHSKESQRHRFMFTKLKNSRRDVLGTFFGNALGEKPFNWTQHMRIWRILSIL